MMFKTHVMFALFLSIIFIQMFEMDQWLFFLIVSVFVAGIPDIDIDKSTFGRRIKPIAFVINMLFGHRGLFHSFIFAVFLFILFGFLGSKTLAAGALLGYSSHLILDGLTRRGIMPLTPLSRFRIRGLIRGGGITDWFLFFLFIVLIVVVLI